MNIRIFNIPYIQTYSFISNIQYSNIEYSIITRATGRATVLERGKEDGESARRRNRARSLCGNVVEKCGTIVEIMWNKCGNNVDNCGTIVETVWKKCGQIMQTCGKCGKLWKKCGTHVENTSGNSIETTPTYYAFKL